MARWHRPCHARLCQKRAERLLRRVGHRGVKVEASRDEPPTATMTLLVDRHVQFIKRLEQKRDSSLAYHMTAHLRMNGVYWGLCALEIMHAGDALDRDALIEFVLSCYDETTGGFGSYPRHDAHMLSTLSAIQILALKDALPVLGERRARIVQCTYRATDVQLCCSCSVPTARFKETAGARRIRAFCIAR